MTIATNYSPEFFESHLRGSLDSAAVVAPLVMDLVHPRSVIDVGCGLGSWAAAFRELGADVLGLDGNYVDRSKLKIHADSFIPHDLCLPIRLNRRFDMAVCLEVAEHLPEHRATSFAEDLTQLAPVLLFSAAIPEQSGVDHINEQWPEYWRTKFARLKFRLIDCFRHQLWYDPQVAPWYAQNLFLYVDEEIAPKFLHANYDFPLSAVHPGIFRGRIEPRSKFLLSALMRASFAAVRRRLSAARRFSGAARCDATHGG